MVLMGRVQQKHMAKVRRHQWRADEGNPWLTSCSPLHRDGAPHAALAAKPEPDIPGSAAR